ncbi:MAG: hypothetical protein KY442_08905 [Proteobacteria bacterium]|nr:hypothetical protein [Pseudomonadota bacterium]
MLRSIAIAALTLLLAACATAPQTAQVAPPPIDPSQVQVYFAPPDAPFEEIALLETSSGVFTYGEQNKLDSVIHKLRVEAAKLGANGVLFQGTADGYGNTGVSVGAGGGSFGGSSYRSGGVGISVSPSKKHARGVAVYFPNPPSGD